MYALGCLIPSAEFAIPALLVHIFRGAQQQGYLQGSVPSALIVVTGITICNAGAPALELAPYAAHASLENSD